jgi:hypothetical protein
MALERRDPVPPGRYHVYVSVDDAPRWSAWTKEHKGKIAVLSTEAQTTTPNNPFFGTTLFGETIKEHAGDFIVFDVKSPVPWVNIGLPTIVAPADMNKRSTSEFFQVPEPEPDSGPLESLSQGVDTMVTLVKWGVGGALAFTVLRVVLGRKGR